MRLALIGAALILLCVTWASFAETPESLFQRGVEAFRRDDWQTAIAAWQEVENRGWANGQLYYDLGNAYYRTGAIGKSIVYYERARKLMPRDPDVKQNLELARMATVDRIEPPVRLIVWDWVDRVRDAFSLRELGWIMLTAGLLTVLGVAGWIFGPYSWRRRLRSTALIVMGLYVVAIAWYGWRSMLDAKTRAVVLEAKVDVFSAPDSSATQVFTLHEGTQVLEMQIVTGWVRIVLIDGRGGWLPGETIERI